MSKVYLQEKLTAGDNITIDSTSKISADVPEITEATQSAAGLMPAADKKKLDDLTLSDELTETGANVVPANVIYNAIDKKQDTLTFDTAPTSGSMNPVTSGGIKIAIDNATPNLTYDAAPTSGSTNLVNSGAVYTAVSAKQNQITISTSAPKSTDGSNGDIWMIYEKDLKDISWSTGTDEEIVRAIAAADAGRIDLVEDAGWAVGDTRKVSLSAMAKSGTYDGVSWSVGETHAAQNVELVLMHQGGVKLADGNACHFVVGMKDSLNESGYMNSSNTNSGSWDGCARRSWCNGAFRQAIPDSLRPIFKQMQTITAETYDGSTLKTSTDFFALPAEREISGTRNISNATEGISTLLVQFTWYTTSANRIKQVNGTNLAWWERSPRASNSTGFCLVNNGGNLGASSANNTFGLSPFGCI